MSSSVIGSNAYGWVNLPRLGPTDGGHSELIAVQQQSLGGVTTVNRRAVKRRWNVPTTILDDWQYALMTGLYETLGPWWLFDATRPNGINTDRRGFTGWRTGAATPELSTPSPDRRWTLPGGTKIFYPEPSVALNASRLVPVRAGQQLVSAVTAKSGSAAGLNMYFVYYTAAMARTQSIVARAIPASGTETRYTATNTVPAGAVLAQIAFSTAGSTMVLTDPYLGPRDPGPAWYSVVFDDLTVNHHTPTKHAITLTLREV